MARKKLAAADETNKRYLHLVDTALFVLCLDHTSPCTAAEVRTDVFGVTPCFRGDAGALVPGGVQRCSKRPARLCRDMPSFCVTSSETPVRRSARS